MMTITINRIILIGFALLMVAIAIPFINEHPTPIPAAMDVRGPIIVSRDYVPARQEDALTMPNVAIWTLAWLQAAGTVPIKVSTEIPLWGLITLLASAFISALIFGIKLAERQNFTAEKLKSHEEL